MVIHLRECAGEFRVETKRFPADAQEATAPLPRLQDELILTCLPMVRNIVEQMRAGLPPCLDADDLHSVGLAGLIQAAARYSSEQAGTFPGYAAMRIRGAILDELRRMDSMSRASRRKAKELGDALTVLEQRLGRGATAEEISAELSLSVGEYTDLLERVRPVSLLNLDADDPEDEDHQSLHEVIADERQSNASERLQHKELVQLLVGRMQRLSDTQRKVLALYYFEELRLAEIAVVFGVTESRICQIHTQALRLLRSQLTAALAA